MVPFPRPTCFCWKRRSCAWNASAWGVAQIDRKRAELQIRFTEKGRSVDPHDVDEAGGPQRQTRRAVYATRIAQAAAEGLANPTKFCWRFRDLPCGASAGASGGVRVASQRVRGKRIRCENPGGPSGRDPVVGLLSQDSAPLSRTRPGLSSLAPPGRFLRLPFSVATDRGLLVRGTGLPASTASMAARRSLPVTGMIAGCQALSYPSRDRRA